jgi:pimeloyl-ACP methyl ester carboxylesterase
MLRNCGKLLRLLIAPALTMMMLLSGGCAAITNYYGLKDIPLEELKASYASAESEFVPVNGMMVHVRDEGKGPVLVLLHGAMSSLHTWDGWVPVLSQDYRVIRMDLPAFGLTGLPRDGSAAFSPDLVEDTVIKVLENRQVTSATFIGNSLGGYISWRLAVDRPDLVSRVVLIDAVSFPQQWTWIVKAPTWFPLQQLAPLITPRYTVAIGIYQAYGDDGRIAPGTIERYHRLLLREGNRDAMLEALDWITSTEKPFGSEPEAGIYDIRQPLMTIWGGKDTWVPYDPIGKQWQTAYPNATHAVYPDAGHVPMEEIPARTLMDLLTFLQATDPEPASIRRSR